MQQINSRNPVSHSGKTPGFSVYLNPRWVGALSLFILFVAAVHAQFGSSLSGTVLDSSGAAISHATVTLTNTGTQQTQTSTTNVTGSYHFGELAPGQYSLVVTASGFK